MLELNWAIRKAGVILDYGMIGAGKTAVGYKIMELIHDVTPHRECFAYCLDSSRSEEFQSVLPDYISPINATSMKTLPLDAALLLDESWLYHSSKIKMDKEEMMSLMDNLFLSRQRGQTVISIIQSLAMLEKTNFRAGYTLCSNYVPITSIATERKELLDMIGRVQKALERRIVELKVPFNRLSHIQSPMFDMNAKLYKNVEGYNWGFYEFELPKFWSEKLSTFWSGS